MRHEQGFSLVELLIVVGIIGAIAAIATPNILGARKSGQEASAVGTLRTCASAEFTYVTSNNYYATLAQLNSASLIDATISGSSITAPKSAYYYLGAPEDVNATQFNLSALRQDARSGKSDYHVQEDGVVREMITIAPATASLTRDAGTPIGASSGSGS